MYIELDVAAGSSQVHDADDLKSFSVHVSEPANTETLARALGPLGRMESAEHAWISIDALRTASARANDPEWSRQFDAMVAYAASKGWLDDSGTSLRAHLETQGPQSPS